jgi:MoxR-like ATPase
MSTSLQALERQLQETLGKTVVGLQSVIRALTIAVVARGHVLLQGPPGLGKTLLSKTLAQTLGGVFKRVQGTADLMPSDITGVHVFDTAKTEFVLRPGPVFADVAERYPSARRQASHSRQVPRQIAIGVHGRQRLGEGCVPLPAQIGDGLCKRLPTGCA